MAQFAQFAQDVTRAHSLGGPLVVTNFLCGSGQLYTAPSLTGGGDKASLNLN